MRTEVVKVRVTPQEKRMFLEAASRDQRTLSDWMRLRLLSAVLVK